MEEKKLNKFGNSLLSMLKIDRYFDSRTKHEADINILVSFNVSKLNKVFQFILFVTITYKPFIFRRIFNQILFKFVLSIKDFNQIITPIGIFKIYFSDFVWLCYIIIYTIFIYIFSL